MFKGRKGVAMIELIFAIVVMGIAMLSIPMITSQSSKGIESAMMQESISQVASNINVVLAKYWDDANTNSNKEQIVLITDSIGFSTREGLTDGVNKRTITGQGDISHATNEVGDSTQDPDGADDMSDFKNIEVKLTTPSLTQTNESYQGDYIDKSISMTTTVTFAPDDVTLAGDTLTYNFDPKVSPTTIPAGSSNIKRVNVLLSTTSTAQVSQNGELKDIKKIQLNGFGCNIGAAIPETIGT